MAVVLLPNLPRFGQFTTVVGAVVVPRWCRRGHRMVNMHRAGKELGVKLRFGITWTDNPNDKPAKFLDGPHVEIPA
ncbi:hypothetical protein [Yersinia pseudotuberculosis]|uniref:hypothetical protein n=1 Tax=Yersinia pseudotuberculosis TaxID=633 RepID=UPI001E2899E5|nr:hypothetical protein [Yersinia pseudotuberculosis]